MDLLIRNIDKGTVNLLDEVAKKEGYSSRNDLVIEILTKYSCVKNQLFADTLSAISRSLIREEIKELDRISRNSVQTIEMAAVRFLKASQKIDTYLSDDFILEDKKDDNFSSSDGEL